MPQSSPFAAYIFDLDGTLTDSSMPIGEGLVAALNAVGIYGIPAESTYGWIGRPLTEIFDHYLNEDRGTGPDEDLFQKMLAAYRAGHDIHFPDGIKIYPGVHETLEALREQGAKLAVATTKYQEAAEFVIRGLKLDTFVDVICGTDLGKPVKPDPYVVHLALEQLGTPASDSLFIGDTPADIQAAHAAGCPAAAASYGFGDPAKLSAAQPEIWLHSIRDLIDG